jgi:hypothetical protein
MHLFQPPEIPVESPPHGNVERVSGVADKVLQTPAKDQMAPKLPSLVNESDLISSSISKAFLPLKGSNLPSIFNGIGQNQSRFDSRKVVYGLVP